jgi:hypothetical protein
MMSCRNARLSAWITSLRGAQVGDFKWPQAGEFGRPPDELIDEMRTILAYTHVLFPNRDSDRARFRIHD